MIWRPGGHLGGGTVTALVDGQLPPDVSERLWGHVVCCSGCRASVEREAWVKSRVSRLSSGEPPLSLGGMIAGRVDADRREADPSTGAWPDPALEDERRGRRLGLVFVGAGSVSAAVLGLTAVSGVVDLPGPTAPGASIRDGATRSPTPTSDVRPTSWIEPAVRLRVLPGRTARAGSGDGAGRSGGAPAPGELPTGTQSGRALSTQ